MAAPATERTKALLRLECVSHAYDNLPVLTGLHLAIRGGESIALWGPSGSGKSTLIALIAGLLEPTSGSRTCELEWNAISVVFQRSVALMRRSCLDNVACPLLARGVSRAAASVEALQALTEVGLGDVAERRALTLSGGQLQRLGVARALVTKPALVLADEPTAGLDLHAADAIVRSLHSRRRGGVATVLATHDARVAARCNRVLELPIGRWIPPTLLDRDRAPG